ncbi:hypothetical protein DFP73DRAFT_616792 [Morchella snyderi]|nr:hypothetical protein DFP73DRAFT_616792 [Morchella snyderi]
MRYTHPLLLVLLPLVLRLTPATAQKDFPPLSGSYKVGTTSITLTDTSRTDSLAPAPNTPRSIVLQLFYPTTNTTTAPLAPYMPPATAAFYEQTYGLPPALNSLQPHVHTNATYAGPRTPGIVIISPGLQSSRHLLTARASDLASIGTVVIAADYLYETDIVEFPATGTYVLSAFAADHNYTDADVLALEATRVADTIYTLDHLRELLRGALPGRAGAAVTPGRVAMVGHSLGGSTAAAVMAVDERVCGGVAMDGKIWGTGTGGVRGAFMFLGAGEHYVASYESWGMLWARLRGWRRELHLAGAAHLAFMDAAVVSELLGMRAAAPEVVEGMVGVIDGLRADELVGLYVRAFVDMVVGRGKRAEEGRRVLAKADERYGEMEFVQ